jgi:hypothetical protein
LLPDRKNPNQEGFSDQFSHAALIEEASVPVVPVLNLSYVDFSNILVI